jgi:hypothetical protein
MGQTTDRRNQYSSGQRPAYTIKLVRDDEYSASTGRHKPSKDRKAHGHKRGFKWIVLIIIAAVGAGAFWQVQGEAKSPFSDQIKSSVAFPLYYPTDTPDGYKLDANTIKNYQGSIFYDLTKQNSHSITISQQPRPQGFDAKSLFQHNPYPTTISPLGTIYDLSYKNQSRYMITAPSSLIYVTSTPKITNVQMQQIVNGLKTSK